jgi:hypothetical protein
METVLLALAALIALGMGAVLLARFPLLGLICVGVVAVFTWDVRVWPSIVNLGGVAVTFPDIVAALLLLSAMLCAAHRRAVIRPAWGTVVFVLLVICIVRGVVSFGLGSAINEARAWIYIAAVCCWILSLRPAELATQALVFKWIVWTGVGVFLIAVRNIASFGLGAAGTGRSVDGEIVEAGRPVVAGQAMVMAVAALVALYLGRQRQSLPYALTSLALFSMVVLAQHRSVWVASLAGLAVYVALMPSSRRWLVVGGATLLLLAAGTLWNLEAIPWLNERLSASATDTRTFEGRLFDWTTLIDQSIADGPDTVLFGAPSGAGWDHLRADGLLVTYPPHNWFVSSYLRVGLLGLLAMVLVGVRALIGARTTRNTPPLAALLVSVAAFCWAYNLSWYLSPILAVALWGSQPARQNDVDIRLDQVRHSEQSTSPKGKSRPRQERQVLRRTN